MENGNLDLQKSLEYIGFSEKEVLVYLALLKLGKGTVTQISRKAGINRPTGYHILASLATKELVKVSGKEPKQEYVAESPDQIEKLLEEKIKKSNEETNQTKEQLKNQQALLEIYEFSYLSLFFVDTTKRALKWFFDSKNKATITYDSFDKVWQLIITDPGQRAIIFNVLQQNGMIGSVADGSFSITNKGEEFLKFIGFNK